MNKDWLDIDLLENYLDGKLDPRTMNRVEREALEDPFVAEALAGLSASPKRSLESLSLLQKQLQERIAEQQHNKRRSVITWQRLSIAAAAAVVFISVGIIFWMKQNNYQDALAKKAKEPRKVEVTIAPKEFKDSIVQSAAQVAAAPARSAAKQSRAIDEAIRTAKQESYASIKKQKAEAAAPQPVNAPVSALSEITVAQAPEAREKPLALTAADRNPADTVNQLDQVVIRGYQKRSREQTTGSRFVVSGKEVKDVPVANVEQLLQGKVAGLNIQNNSGQASGDTNAEPSIGWNRFKAYLIKRNRFSNDTKAGDTAVYKFNILYGRPVNITVVKGISRDYDDETIRLIKNGPDWKLTSPASTEVSVVLKF